MWALVSERAMFFLTYHSHGMAIAEMLIGKCNAIVATDDYCYVEWFAEPADRPPTQQLRVAVRYHRERLEAAMPVRRVEQRRVAADFAYAIVHWRGVYGTPDNTAALHDWLISEHAYPGSQRSVQRYIAEHYKPPPRTCRRFETPSGAQAQVDWAHFHYSDVIVICQCTDLYGFAMILSHSRQPALIWSDLMAIMSWLAIHNQAFTCLDGIAAVVRVHDCKTAVARGACSR